MRLKLRLNTRMFLFILTTTALIFAASSGYISKRYLDQAIDDAKKIVTSTAREYANIIKSNMDKDFGVSRSMAIALLECENNLKDKKEEIQFNILEKVLEKNPTYIASFLQWELKDCEPNYKKEHGRRRYLCYRKLALPDEDRLAKQPKVAEIKRMKGKVDTLTFDPENPYYYVKKHLCEFIVNPYFYSYQSVKEMPEATPKKKDAILETTIIVPIYENKKFRALTGVDIPLNHFLNIIKQIKPFKESSAFILSNNGSFVAHPNPKLLAKPFVDSLANKEKRYDVIQKIHNGKEFVFYSKRNNKKYFHAFTPIKIGNTNTPWSLCIRIPLSVILEDAHSDFYFSIWVALIGILLLGIIIWRISNNISNPIRSTTNLMKNMSLGKFNSDDKLIIKSDDEVGEMAKSANILIDAFNRINLFAKSIGEGDLNANYKLLSKYDSLGHSLIYMRENLRLSKYKIEAQNRELEKFSKIAQETDNAVTMINKYGQIEWINKAFTRMYGFNHKDLIDHFDNSIYSLSNHIHIKDLLKNCIEKKETLYYESTIISKSGHRIYAQTTITPILDDKNNVLRLVAIDSNITDVQLAKNEILEKNNELEITNATKDKFFSILAHDLKNPFTALISLSQSLHENHKDLNEEELSEFLNRVNKSAWNIYSLLENLLTWSRLQTNRIDFNPESEKLINLIESTISLLEDSSRKKEITISCTCSKTLDVYIDQNMILTVLRNLLHNAIKFTKPKGSIHIFCKQINEHYVQINVTDSGIGLTNEEISKLFRIDVKTKNIGKSKEKGTGLGLILCKEFVEKNGGNIWVKSEIEEGSEFIFTLPLKSFC